MSRFNEEGLLPCPFCDGEEASVSECVFSAEAMIEEGWSQHVFFVVDCPCGASHGDYPGHDSVVDAVVGWNMRGGVVQP